MSNAATTSHTPPNCVPHRDDDDGANSDGMTERVNHRLEDVVVLQRKRLCALQDALLSKVERLTGASTTTVSASAPPPSPTPAGCVDAPSRDVHALRTVLTPSTVSLPTTTPVIVLDITSLYSTSGTGLRQPSRSPQKQTRHVGVQTAVPTASEPALHSTEHARGVLDQTGQTLLQDEIRELRERLSVAQSRAVFQQESLVRLSKEFSKAKETLRLLSQEDDDLAELQAYTRTSGSRAAMTEGELSEGAKDRELRRLRTLMRFSELKKDSDLLPEAYTHLDTALKEMAALRREQTKDRVKLDEARQCVRAVAGCVFELVDLLPGPREKSKPSAAAAGAVRDRLRYVLERCRDVDPSIPAPPSAWDAAPAATATSPPPQQQVTGARSDKPPRRAHRDGRVRDRRPPTAPAPAPAPAPSSHDAEGLTLTASQRTDPRDPAPAAATTSETATDRRRSSATSSRRHSVASYARVQEAVADARRSSSSLSHLTNADPQPPHQPQPPPRHRSASAATPADVPTGAALLALQRARAQGRPPTPHRDSAAALYDALLLEAKRPCVAIRPTPGLYRASSHRGGQWT